MRRALITVAVLAYAAFLVRYECYGAGGSDSSGYLNAARMIARGHLKIRVTPLDVMGLDDSWRGVFLPLGFAKAPEPKTFVPSYPLGYPLQMVPFGVIGGWNHAPFYVTPIAALLTLLVLYKLARELDLSEDLALGAVAMLALSPGWVNQALQPMSDVPATLWCSLTMLCALRGQRSWRWAAACGAAFGMSVWVRPSNLLLALAIGCALRWRVRPLAIAVAASAPFGVALMLTNRWLFGSGLVTGYGGIGGMLSFNGFPPCAKQYTTGLFLTLTPIVFPAALLVLFDRHVPMWIRATLLTWFGAFFAFYSVYPICDAWWYLRFLLPAYPPLILGSLLLMRDFVRVRAVQMAMVAAVAVTGILIIAHYRLWYLRDGEMAYQHAIHWARKQLPPNALVTTMQVSGAYAFYAEKVSARYDFLDPQRFEELRAYAGNAGLKWYALVFDWEEPELFRKMPGKWTKIGDSHNVQLLRLDD